MGSYRGEPSPRRRPPVRKVTFTNRVGGSLAVMKTTFERGIELHVDPEYRGSGKKLEGW